MMKACDYIPICKSKYINCIALALPWRLKKMLRQLYFSNIDKVKPLSVSVERTDSSNKSYSCFVVPNVGLRLECLTSFSKIFQLYRGGSFIGEGNQSTRRKPLTCCKSLTNFITWCCIEYTSPGWDSNPQR
jgi:hypothetical protein